MWRLWGREEEGRSGERADRPLVAGVSQGLTQSAAHGLPHVRESKDGIKSALQVLQGAVSVVERGGGPQGFEAEADELGGLLSSLGLVGG